MEGVVSMTWTVPTVRQIERMKREDFPDPRTLGVMIAEAVMFGGMTLEERSAEIRRIRDEMSDFLNSGEDIKGTIRMGANGREICYQSGSPGKWTRIEEEHDS